MTTIYEDFKLLQEKIIKKQFCITIDTKGSQAINEEQASSVAKMSQNPLYERKVLNIIFDYAAISHIGNDDDEINFYRRIQQNFFQFVRRYGKSITPIQKMPTS